MAYIWVAKPVTKTTMNTAIASASPGDVVIVPNGTYDKLASRRTNDNVNVGVSGTLGNNIILRAETPGGVKFTGTFYIMVYGSHIIIRDFMFEDIRSYSPLTLQLVVINAKGDHIRVTNNHFKNLGVRGDKWGGYAIRHQTGADNGEIDYNTFENWASIELLSPLKVFNLHIHHNYLTSPVAAGADHDSAMHIGGDGLDIQATNSNHIVEYNYFKSCNGDPETISSKISSVTYRYNVFDGREYPGKMGALVLRAGDDSIVESNYFYGMGQGNGGFAIRIYGEGHKIINNYIEESLSDSISILVASGIHTTPHTSGHVRAKNIEILNNTIVNSTTNSNSILVGKWWPTELYKPENVTLKNNIIVQSLGALVKHYGCTGTFIWENNLHWNAGSANYWVYGESGTAEPASGITHATPNLIQGTNIQRLQPSSTSAIEQGTPDGSVTDDIDGHTRDATNPDIGCDEYSSFAPERLPITKDEVGVSWLRKIPAKGSIVGLTYPVSVEHGAMCDINAAIKNIGELSGRFKTQILINSILLVTSPEFTLAGGATSTDKIDPFKAPLSGESMDIIIKCIRSE
jgi:hypothetical protein